MSTELKRKKKICPTIKIGHCNEMNVQFSYSAEQLAWVMFSSVKSKLTGPLTDLSELQEYVMDSLNS